MSFNGAKNNRVPSRSVFDGTGKNSLLRRVNDSIVPVFIVTSFASLLSPSFPCFLDSLVFVCVLFDSVCFLLAFFS